MSFNNHLPQTASDLTLIFDADDTLWGSNAYFERVIADYLDWLAHPDLSHAEIRAVLDDIERVNAATHGYGSRAFLLNLAECFHTLKSRPLEPTEQRQLDALAADLIEHRVHLFDGVADTLGALSGRHDLKLMTKGHPEEQQRKIDASGLAGMFSSIHIVPEKNPDVYAEVIAAQHLSPAATWMIGNSPRSDILPARAVGIGAVYIPSSDTWALEHAELDPNDGGVLTLAAFPDLLRHF